MKAHEWIGIILEDLKVARMEAFLNGSGDSGDIEYINYYDKDGNDLGELKISSILDGVKIGSDPRANAHSKLRDVIVQDANNEGNWYDGDGGYVYANYSVFNGQVVTESVDLTHYEPEPDEDELDEDYDEDCEI